MRHRDYNMENIECIFCMIPSENGVIEDNGFLGRKCKRCGLIFISPRPDYDEIVDLYGHDNAHVSAWSQVQAERLSRLHARHTLDILRPHRGTGTLLEMGSGAGYFLDEARAVGYIPCGIELNAVQAKLIRSLFQIECHECTLQKDAFFGRRFGVIYHCDVISHFYDPISEFRLIHSKLEDDGILMFETGNFGDLDSKSLRSIGEYQYPDHLFFFGVENVLTLLQKTGFEIIEVRRFSLVPQMAVRKALGCACKLRKLSMGHRSTGAIPNHEVGSVDPADRARVSVIDPVRYVWQTLNHLLRYRVGAVAAKKGHPQTVIFVAKRAVPELPAQSRK